MSPMLHLKLANLLGAKIVPWVEGQYAAVSQADKTPMQLEGWIRGLLCIGGNTYPNVFFVPKAPKTRTKEPFEMLIGNDLLWRIGELNINYATRKLTLRDHNTKFAYSFNLDPTTVDTIIIPADANKETFRAGEDNPPLASTTPPPGARKALQTNKNSAEHRGTLLLVLVPVREGQGISSPASTATFSPSPKSRSQSPVSKPDGMPPGPGQLHHLHRNLE